VCGEGVFKELEYPYNTSLGLSQTNNVVSATQVTRIVHFLRGAVDRISRVEWCDCGSRGGIGYVWSCPLRKGDGTRAIELSNKKTKLCLVLLCIPVTQPGNVCPHTDHNPADINPDSLCAASFRNLYANASTSKQPGGVEIDGRPLASR
jgi:hypothetical protein